jgi:hypothetical protein
MTLALRFSVLYESNFQLSMKLSFLLNALNTMPFTGPFQNGVDRPQR